MNLKPMTKETCEQVREWRNMNIDTLRTPFYLTKEMQENFYDNVVCDRHSNSRWFGLYVNGMFIGMGGIANIEWENGIGEISIILNPTYRGKGYGKKAVDKLLLHAFGSLRLHMIYGECYNINPALDFWKSYVERFWGYTTVLPDRKFVNGEHVYSTYFSIRKDDFCGTNNT